MPTYTAGKPKNAELYVEPGKYRFRVIEAKDDTSRGGADMVKVKLRVLHQDGSEGPALFDYFVFTDTCFWRVDNFLTSCGKHPGEGVAIDVNADDLVGYEGEANLIVETYEGKKNNKVAAYLFDEF